MFCLFTGIVLIVLTDWSIKEGISTYFFPTLFKLIYYALQTFIDVKGNLRIN